jgi:hypothetical protein
MKRSRSVPLGSIALVLGCSLTWAEPIPVPKSRVIATTATSRAFMSAEQNLEPLNLAQHGYEEKEFFISGVANVYDWAQDGTLSVKTAKAPYENRILVRRPTSPAKFSGTVYVEPLFGVRRFDWAMMWGYGKDYFMEHGDVWVGVTAPGALESLKKFDPSRYASLSMNNPTPTAACPGAGKNGPAAMEEGLRWDVYSQLSVSLRTDAADQPMRGYAVRRVFMTTQAGDIVTYINALHTQAQLSDGKPAYDGYVVRNPPAPSKISLCAPGISATDSRRQIRDIGVPVISVVAQGEVAASLSARKADSDNPQGRYRLYEVAGAAHIEKFAYSSLPSMEEQTAIGLAQGTVDWPLNVKCDPEIPLSNHPLLMYAFHGAFRNLDDWVSKGVTPPHAERIAMKDGQIENDRFSHAVGGVRSPWVDVPLATYETASLGPGTCRELGHKVAFPKSQVDGSYRPPSGYVQSMNESVDQTVKAGYFTETDGKKMKAELSAEYEALK